MHPFSFDHKWKEGKMSLFFPNPDFCLLLADVPPTGIHRLTGRSAWAASLTLASVTQQKFHCRCSLQNHWGNVILWVVKSLRECDEKPLPSCWRERKDQIWCPRFSSQIAALLNVWGGHQLSFIICWIAVFSHVPLPSCMFFSWRVLEERRLLKYIYLLNEINACLSRNPRI